MFTAESIRSFFYIPLNSDMGNALQLKIALGRFRIVIFLHGTNNVVGMGVMPLN